MRRAPPLLGALLVVELLVLSATGCARPRGAQAAPGAPQGRPGVVREERDDAEADGHAKGDEDEHHRVCERDVEKGVRLSSACQDGDRGSLDCSPSIQTETEIGLTHAALLGRASSTQTETALMPLYVGTQTILKIHES